MATIPQPAIQRLQQAGPKIVAPPNAPQAVVALTGSIQRLKVHIRKRESRAKHILLGTINDGAFRVVRPIPVHLDVRGRTVIASWRQVDEFGTGKSSSLACDDLGRTIAELYLSLKADQRHLGPDLAKVWVILQQHVVQRTNEIA